MVAIKCNHTNPKKVKTNYDVDRSVRPTPGCVWHNDVQRGCQVTHWLVSQ